MKKTNLILLIALVIVIAIVAVIYFVDNKSETTVLRDFAVEDTASIDKIFLADKENNSVTLERENGYWMVNGTYKARKDYINVLLTTIKKLEVSAPVPEAKLDKVLRDLSSKQIKCEIYQNGENTKTYYVGGVTEDNAGTYMIMEGSELPFVMHIPGFTGFLTVRYLPYINEWRERIVFNYKFEDIREVAVEYPSNPDDSFIAISNGDNTYDFKNLDGSDVQFEFDTMKVKEYVSRVKFIGFEAYILDEIQQFKIDSLAQEPLAGKFSVTDKNGETKVLKTYLRQNTAGSMDDNGELYPYDIDRLYGVINDDTEAVLLQYYVIDPITFRKSDFAIEN
jgi:hypothetical protein